MSRTRTRWQPTQHGAPVPGAVGSIDEVHHRPGNLARFGIAPREPGELAAQRGDRGDHLHLSDTVGQGGGLRQEGLVATLAAPAPHMGHAHEWAQGGVGRQRRLGEDGLRQAFGSGQVAPIDLELRITRQQVSPPGVEVALRAVLDALHQVTTGIVVPTLGDRARRKVDVGASRVLVQLRLARELEALLEHGDAGRAVAGDHLDGAEVVERMRTQLSPRAALRERVEHL